MFKKTCLHFVLYRERFETDIRRVRDTHDDSVTILRENMSHEVFEHVRYFSDTRAIEAPAFHARNFRTPRERFKIFWKLPRECRSQFVVNSRITVR